MLSIYLVVYRVNVLLIYGVSVTYNFEDKVSSILKKSLPRASNQRLPVHQPCALPPFLAATHQKLEVITYLTLYLTPNLTL